MMSSNAIKLSIRLDLPDGSRFGPGKAALLEAILGSGSILGAAKSLEMSYPRALRLVNEMNSQFIAPLITKYQGGSTRGGAKLSTMGVEVLQSYNRLNAMAADSASQDLKILAEVSKT